MLAFLTLKYVVSFGPGTRFECTKCSECCKSAFQGIGLTDNDSRKISELVDLLPPTERVSHPIFVSRIRCDVGICPLLERGSCKVYGKHPLTCRLYPFYLSAKPDGTLIVCVEHCPGVGRGPLVSREFIEEKVLGVATEEASLIPHLQELARRRYPELIPMAAGYETSLQRDALEPFWGRFTQFMRRGEVEQLSPRERVQCFISDVLPWLMQGLSDQGAPLSVTESDLIKAFGSEGPDFVAKVSEGVRKELQHRGEMMSKGHIFNDTGRRYDTDDKIAIEVREIGIVEVKVRDLMKGKTFSPEAMNEELEYLREVTSRGGIFSGLLLPRLTIHQELLLLYWLADALELKACVAAIHDGADKVEVSHIRGGILSVDRLIPAMVERVRRPWGFI